MKNGAVILDTKSRKCCKRMEKAARCWQLYLILLVPLLYLIIFHYVPMAGVQIAFKDYTPAKGIWGSDFAGFKYFVRFFKSYQFKNVIRNTLVVSLYQIAVSTPAPIILALLINTVENKAFKKAAQTITYLPHFISVVVLIGMVNQIFNPISGVYGSVYEILFNGKAPNILGILKAFYHIYVWTEVWQNTGWASIIYVAALTNSDPSLHEAAQIDGCDYMYFFVKIAIPLSKAIIAVITLYYAIGHRNAYFNAFLYLTNKKLFPLQIVLREILVINRVDGSMITDEAMEAKEGLSELLKYSLIVVSVVSVLIIYPFVQKYFVKGVMIGSVKGVID